MRAPAGADVMGRLDELLPEGTPAGSQPPPPEAWLVDAEIASTEPGCRSTPVAVQGCEVGMGKLESWAASGAAIAIRNLGIIERKIEVRCIRNYRVERQRLETGLYY